MARTAGGIVFGILFGIGIIFALLGYPAYVEGKESENWPAVNGIVLDSYVLEDYDSDGTTYAPYIRYRYIVDRTYTSDQIYPGDMTVWTSSYSNAKKTVDKHPPGSQITVYYDPDDPSKSVLEPGLKFSSLIFLTIGISLIGIGFIIGVVLFLKGSRKSPVVNLEELENMDDKYVDPTYNRTQADSKDTKSISYCHICGVELTPEGRFCLECGIKVR